MSNRDVINLDNLSDIFRQFPRPGNYISCRLLLAPSQRPVNQIFLGFSCLWRKFLRLIRRRIFSLMVLGHLSIVARIRKSDWRCDILGPPGIKQLVKVKKTVKKFSNLKFQKSR